MSTEEARQGVQFKVHVKNSKENETFQFVQGIRVKETPTHITVDHPWRALSAGEDEIIRTYRIDRIKNGKSGIQRLNF